MEKGIMMNRRTDKGVRVGDDDTRPPKDLWGLECVTHAGEERIPTPDLMRQELLAVVKYWVHRDLDLSFFMFT